MFEIPQIKTERLCLTAFNEKHFDRYAALLASPACTRWIGDGRTLNRMNAWRSMAMLLGHWQLRGFGMWAVEKDTDDTLIGRVGLLQPEGWPDIELGWLLCPDCRHQGYATEASEAALAFAWKQLRKSRVISLIHQENDDARRVAERLGGECVEEKNFLGKPIQVYAYYAPKTESKANAG